MGDANPEGLVSNFMASQDARLSKFEADFKQQQRPSRHDDEREIVWLDVEEPLDLVDTSKESVYESLIKEMPKCSLNYDFRIKKGDLRNLKNPCMIRHKFTANAYIDVDLPINIMSLAYYTSVRKSRYKYRGRKFVELGRDIEQAFVEYASSYTTEAGVHQSNPNNDKLEEDGQKGEGNPENTNATERKEEQRDAPQPELKDRTDIKKIGPSRHDEEREIVWLDVEEPLYLVDTSEESVYESLIKEMPKCQLIITLGSKRVTQETLKSPA
ncbi:hypothetical protein Tco_0001759 [Tanacetum coccineum]